MRFANLLAALCTTLVLAVSSAYAAAPDLAREIEEAVELLLASVRAEESARQDFQRRLERGALDRAERRDYELYLDELARMVEENRARLMALSHEVDAAAAAPGGASLAAEAPPTTDERVAALDADLDASLSEFDELLLNEMERVRRQSEPPAEAHTGESAAGGAEQDGQSEQGGEGETAASGETDAGSGGGAGAQTGAEAEAGTVPGGAATGGAGTEPGAAGQAGSRDGGEAADAGVSTGGGTGGGTPTDIADASDDDVVARQLREAAERETDPALKERLWEEYRRYKSGARASGGEGR